MGAPDWNTGNSNYVSAKRTGAFEVYLVTNFTRTESAGCIRLIHSKLQSHQWPSMESIAWACRKFLFQELHRKEVEERRKIEEEKRKRDEEERRRREEEQRREEEARKLIEERERQMEEERRRREEQ